MRLAEADPEAIDVDPMNERADVEDVADLAESIRTTGVVQPPLVRERESGYTVVVGQRRVLAAREADVEKIPVVVTDYDDRDALRASISENVDLFRREVSVKDRCAALQRYWEHLGGEGMPSYAHLGSELGVPSETIRAWLEPLNEAWKDTALDVDTREPTDSGEELADAVGATTLADIRRITGGGEDGERLAHMFEEDKLTRADVRGPIKEALASGQPLDTAIAESRRDRVEVTVRFDPDTSEAIRNQAAREGENPKAVVRTLVERYVDRSAPTSDSPTPSDLTDSEGPETTTVGDLL